MVEAGTYHGGLVMFGHEDAMLERLARIAATTLEDYGHPVEKNAIQDPRSARVTASHYAVRVSLMQGMVPGEHGQRGLKIENFKLITPPDRQWRVVIELFPADPAGHDRDISELLLVVMLYRASYEFDVQMIEWLDPLTLLTTGEFLQAFANVCPTLVTRRIGIADPNDARFAPADETPEEVEDDSPFAVHLEAVEVDATQSDIRRLAIWGMTGMLAFLSAPVAASSTKTSMSSRPASCTGSSSQL